jgi:hypothetical protein
MGYHHAYNVTATLFVSVLILLLLKMDTGEQIVQAAHLFNVLEWSPVFKVMQTIQQVSAQLDIWDHSVLNVRSTTQDQTTTNARNVPTKQEA